MNDIFIEQLVKRKRRVKDTVIFIALLILLLLIPATFVVLAVKAIVPAYCIHISFFLFVFGVWLAWYVRSHQNVEFEYQMVQDTLVVSKIIAKRKRREIIKADVRKFDILSNGENPQVKKLKLVRAYEAAENPGDGKGTYYAVYQHPVYGRCAVIFSPNERILEAMKPYLKKDIVLKLFYNRG